MRFPRYALAFVALVVPAAAAQLMVVDSGGDRVMLFDSTDGALLDADWLTDAGAVGWFFTTPKEALVVGSEIWVSDQVADAIHRFDLSRNFLSSVTAHPGGGVVDNLRGLGTDGTNVYLSVFPSSAALRGVAVYDTNGVPQDFFADSGSLFDAEPFLGDFLLTPNSTNGDVERRSITTGAVINNFANDVTFPQQVQVLSDDSVIAVSTIAASGVEGVYHFNSDGSLRLYIDTENLKTQFGETVPRAAWLLDNGDYLISASTGVYTFDVAEESYARLISGVDGQYINIIPEPSGLALLLFGAFGVLRRRG